MGITLKQLTDTVSQIKDYILNKTHKIDQISYAQKTVNTELDYGVFEVTDMTINKTTPLIFSNVNSGNMELSENGYIKLQKDKTYVFHTGLYKADYNRGIALVDSELNVLTDFNTTSVGSYIYEAKEDIEVTFIVSDSGSISVSSKWGCVNVYEINRQIVIDPVEYVNQHDGIEDTPVGHIIPHMGTTSPKHYLICDGSEYNITDYPYLSQYIEDEYGAVNYFGGDGINTFCVPQVTENMRVNTNADINLGNKKIITVEFAELSGYDDVVHVPNMTITENENESTYYFLKQTDNKYLVLKKFNAKVIGLVNSFKTASGSKARGEFRQYRNNTLVQNISYQAPDKTVGSQGTAEGMFSFEEGDVFYFYTPATDGYPQQYGTIIIEDNTVNSISCIKYEPTYYMIRQNTNYIQPSIYSEEEKVVGCWIDGKPLYEKTLSVIISNESYTEIGTENIEQIVDIKGFIILNNGTVVPVGYSNNEYYISACYENNAISYRNAQGFNNYPGYVTVQYTKTTDAENSFTDDMIQDYIIQSSESEPYSEEEVTNAVNEIWQ